jgi:hypothetical protein
MSDVDVRAQDRHTLSLHMEVFRKAGDKDPLFKCRTRNIGSGGTMIRNRGINLRKGARIKVLLKASYRSVQNEFEMDAKVLWKTPTAIGFEFSPTKISKQQEFKRFLLKAKVGTHARARKRWNKDNITATVLTQKVV